MGKTKSLIRGVWNESKKSSKIGLKKLSKSRRRKLLNNSKGKSDRLSKTVMR